MSVASYGRADAKLVVEAIAIIGYIFHTKTCGWLSSVAQWRSGAVVQWCRYPNCLPRLCRAAPYDSNHSVPWYQDAKLASGRFKVHSKDLGFWHKAPIGLWCSCTLSLSILASACSPGVQNGADNVAGHEAAVAISAQNSIEQRLEEIEREGSDWLEKVRAANQTYTAEFRRVLFDSDNQYDQEMGRLIGDYYMANGIDFFMSDASDASFETTPEQKATLNYALVRNRAFYYAQQYVEKGDDSFIARLQGLLVGQYSNFLESAFLVNSDTEIGGELWRPDQSRVNQFVEDATAEYDIVLD